jgi:hypothetical protein
MPRAERHVVSFTALPRLQPSPADRGSRFSERSLQHLRLRRFRVAGAVHRVGVEVRRAALVHPDTDRAGANLPDGGIRTARGDVRLTGQAEVGPKAIKSAPF